MSKALEERGLTLAAARLDMRRIANAHGSATNAIKALGLSPSTWHSAYSGAYGPGPKLLALFYGPTGRDVRPELRGGIAPKAPPAAPQPEEIGNVEEASTPPSIPIAASIVGPDAFGGLTVAELLLRAQRRAVELETELEEALGEIDSLKAMATRLGGEHG